MDTLRGSSDIDTLVAGLAATPGYLFSAVGDVGQDALDRAPPGEWSPRTVLAHLRDDEFMVMRLRLERMLVEEQPELEPFDEKAWAASRYRGRDSHEEILADFRTQREASIAILRRLTAEELRRTGSQPEIGRFDVHWWLQHWVDHDNNHIAQIRDTLATV